MLISKVRDIQSLKLFINVFPSLWKANFNAMHHFIQILTIISEVMMQVSLHGEDYITQTTYRFILWIHMLVFSLHIIWHGCSLFSNCDKSSTSRLRSLYKRFTFVVNVARSYVPVLLAKQWGVTLRSAFDMGRENI